ncbi:MAG: hypothetical protein MSA21_10630 [Lachnospiraceae bacterium]|nr:hypothetical protein [Lachnospiraceae bacterium]
MSLSTLNTLFYVFLALTIVFFLISVLLFFLFDIRRVFMIRTGRAARRDIKKIQDESFQTGRLSRNSSANSLYNGSGSLTESDELQKTEEVSNISGNASSNTNTAGNAADTGANATTVLQSEGTTVLNQEETTVLNAGVSDGATSNVKIGKFLIIRKEINIHTDEVI